MKRTGWGLLALSVVLLAMAWMQARRVPDKGNPSGELAEKLGAFTCPVIVFIPAVVLLILGRRKRPDDVSPPTPLLRDDEPPRESEDYEVLDD